MAGDRKFHRRSVWTPPEVSLSDPSNGYEDCATAFIRSRNPRIGPSVVRAWAATLPPAAHVLELGCGHGIVSQALVESGVTLFAVDASATLLAEFRARFPHVQTECASAETSSFFHRTFDGVIAWGLIFLLEEETQYLVLARMAAALRPGGHLLFTAGTQRHHWIDVMTRRPSLSLGATAYRQILAAHAVDTVSETEDEGCNHYYFGVKRDSSAS